MTPKKILFANVPLDGHFNPLTPLAVQLLQQGHDVRWYTGAGYREKVEKHGIRFYPCVKALDFSLGNPEELLPGRNRIKSKLGKLKFDIEHGFVRRSTEYFDDIKDINRHFDFDLMIADVLFTATPFVKHKLYKPVISIGVMPLTETSVDLPPAGLGLTPAKNIAGRLGHSFLRWVTDACIFRDSKKLVDSLYRRYKMKPMKGNIFNVLCHESTLLLQSGTPGFEYYRSDMADNIHFIGPLIPPPDKQQPSLAFADKLKQYKNVILVTQGTVERDINKLIVPALEAFKSDADTLVVVTTGGSQTKELRARYARANIIIEDFIPYDAIMPYASVYVTNGGYGGVMYSIQNGLPMVTAGVHEGKNEICARVGYFNLGIDLRTEKPSAQQIRNAVLKVLSDDRYRNAVDKLRAEFAEYDTADLFEDFVEQALNSIRKKGPKEYALFELEAA